jgi:hypothetical protein
MTAAMTTMTTMTMMTAAMMTMTMTMTMMTTDDRHSGFGRSGGANDRASGKLRPVARCTDAEGVRVAPVLIGRRLASSLS